jgi:hypothetical protein
MSTLQPYMFEPELDEEEIIAREEQQRLQLELTQGRAGNTHWCNCGKCISMEEDTHSKCCYEVQQISSTRQADDCVTSGERFENTIINPEVLKITHHELLLASRDGDMRKTLALGTNTNLRYLAYRTFIKWINAGHTIGFKNRIVIPSCVIGAIRKKWPSEDGQYVGFKPPSEGYPL